MKRFSNFGLFVAVSLCMAMLLSALSMAADLKDIKGHWAEEYIEYGVDAGYISGYADGTFLPDKTVTRAEFSKMINSAVKITSTGSAKGEFTDVVTKDWFFNEVKRAENAGYITGYEDGSFRPNNSVTRQEAAVILSRIVLPVAERKEISSFTDGKTIDTWAQDAVSMIAAKGYIKGDENGKFLPKNALTRSQAAKLICEFVKNENIVNNDKNTEASNNEIVFSETLFTDNVIFNFEDDAEVDVTFKNCRILGNVNIMGGKVTISLENSVAKIVNVSTDDSYIGLDKSSTVKNTYVYNPVTLVGNGFENIYLSGADLSDGIVNISGDCKKVEVSGDVFVSADIVDKMVLTSKSNLVIQSGTIKALDVKAEAKGSTINLAKKAVVEKADNKAAVTYVGSGTVEVANNEVTGVVYDGVTVEQTTGKKAEGDGTPTASSEFFEGLTVTPSKGKTNVAITTNVSFSFKNKIYDNKGKSISAGYLEDSLELRKGSANGTRIAFTASIASDKNILVDPASNLASSTKYYVVIPEGTFKDEDGRENDEYVTYFTTKAADSDDDGGSAGADDEDATVTMSPKSGEKDVSVNTTIKLTFSGTLKAYSGTLDEDYVEDTIEIYEGSTSGDTVDFSATISSKTITLTPTRLLGDTKYYVVIPNNKFKVGGSTLSKTTMSFTTGEGLAITISPENGATGVSTLPEITVTFAEPMLQLNKNHDALTEDYIQDDVLLFRKSSATKTGDEYQVSYSVTEIAENGRKFVIVPDEELESGISYYIIIQEESLYGKTSESENKKVTSSFKTATAMAPMFYPTDGKENVSPATEIRVSFSSELLTYSTKSAERVEVTDEYLDELINGDEDGKNKNRISLKRGTKLLDITATLDSDGKTIIITPDDALLEEKTYTISVAKNCFYSSDGKKANAAGTATFNTNEALSPTFTPKDDAEGVDVTKNPTIKFSENIFNNEGEEIKNSYLKNTAIKFVDQYGEDVEFTASIEGSTITVEPEENLEGNMEYTLTLVAGAITNEDGIANAEKSVTFKTKVSYTITITPEKAETSVSPLVNPTVKFGTPVLALDYKEVDADYAYDYIFLSETKAASDVDADNVVPATIDVGEDGRTFTLIPENALEFGKKYYVNVAKGGFYYEDEKTKNSAASSYFTVIKEPVLSKVSVSSTTETQAKISFTSSVKGTSDDELVVFVVEDENGEVVGTKVVTTTASTTITIRGLQAGTEYNFTTYLLCAGEIKSNEIEVSPLTKGTAPESDDDDPVPGLNETPIA